MSRPAVLVTGAAGFIGSHLCEALLRRGTAVIGLDNFNSFYDPAVKRSNWACVAELARSLQVPCTLAEGDITDTVFLEQLFSESEIEAVIHLAAYAGVRPSIADPLLYAAVNVDGTVALLEQMRRRGIRRLLFASSSSVYGNNTKVPFSEDDPVDRAISPYAATKKAAEVLCHTWFHLYGITTACLRFFTVFGPRQRPDLAIHKFLRLVMENKPIPFFGDGTMRRDHTYIDDIIDGVLRALDWSSAPSPKYEIFNLGNSRTVTLDELVKTVEQVTGRKAVIDYQPQPPGDVECTYADISRASRVLGYRPRTDLITGMRSEYEWLKQMS
jgi:UDP-glucuronate 4-epimerase